MNSFWLASLLALLIGLNLSFLVGALVWFVKITNAVPFESVKVFHKDLFLALYCSLFLSMIFRLLCLFPLTIWPFGPLPPQSQLWWRPHKELCFDWSAGQSAGVLNPSKCEASFSVNLHQANLQPNLLLLNFRLHFNPTPTFLGITFDRTLSFSKHVSSLKAKFFPRLKALHCISAPSWAPLRNFSLFCIKLFLRPLLTYVSPGWFPFLIVTNITKLEHASTKRLVAPSPAASRPPLFLFSSLSVSTSLMSHPDSFYSLIL